MRNRSWLLILAVLIIGVMVVACGGPDGAEEPSDEPENGETNGSEEEPAEESGEKGGTIEYAFIERPQSLDPNVWTGRSDNDIMRQIYDSLVFSPAPGEYEPWLAESWDISDDGTVYTFKLREDVTFHDGTPLNAEAVKATWERMMDPETNSLRAGDLGPYDRTEVIDDYTVELHLEEPFAPLMDNMTSTPLVPVSPAAVEEHGSDFARNPVGTGPFMFEKWDGNDLHLVRNPDYDWAPESMDHEGPAHLEKLIFMEVPEASTRMTTLQTGEANVAHYPVMDQISDFEDQGFQVFAETTPGFVKSMPINIQMAPTDDLLIRQAILYGVDRQELVDLLMFGWTEVAYGTLTRASFGYNPEVEDHYNYDPEKAAELLDEAGWEMDDDGTRYNEDGDPLEIQLIMFDSTLNKEMAELVQAMLLEMGFDASLDISAYDAFAARVTEGDYNLAEMNWTALDPHLVLYNMYHSSQVTGGGQFNRTRVQSEELDELIESGRVETDVEKRAEIYGDLQMKVLEDALILPIWDNVFVTVADEAVKGLHFDRESRPLIYDAWVE